MYLASTSTQSEKESWLMNFDASFHMRPHRNWFYKYEELKGGDVLLGYDSLTKIVKWGKFRLILIDGRKGALPDVLHIPGLAQNLIFISRMGDVGLQSVFEKDTCKMVWGAMVLMRGIRI